METLNFEFETREDREMAFHNIVKWYGNDVAAKVEFLEIAVHASDEIMSETSKIIEKHQGRLKRTKA